MPNQAGTYFDGSLTYLAQHSEEGCIGLIVNRIASITFADLLEQLKLEAAGDTLPAPPVLDGGPVGPGQGFIIHSDDHVYDSSQVLASGLCLTTTEPILRTIAEGTGPSRYLIALGYAGWGPGQLESEIEQHAWLTTPADPAVLFDTPVADRLTRVTDSLGFDFALLAGKQGES